jgi:molybdopterin synthase sulfur carrier subunit
MKIYYFAMLRDITGAHVELWNEPAQTLGDLLAALCKKYGSQFSQWVSNDPGSHGKLSIFLINGEDYRSRQGLETPLKAEDTIYIFPPMAGG